MERTKPNKKPDAILCADMHLRSDQPVARMDSYWETQFVKLNFIWQLQREQHCPILHAGDLFNHWKPSPHLLTKTMTHLPDAFYTVYG